MLVCANADGSKKKKIFGKAKKPICFKDIKSLPIKCFGNQKAWTSAIFRKKRFEWDSIFIKRKRNIWFVVDNCSDHPKILGMTVEICF